MSGLLLPVCSLFFSILLCYVYFSKKRIDIMENKMYSIMLVCGLLDSMIVIILQTISTFYNESFYEIVSLLNKIDFLLLIIICTCIFLYVSLITINKFRKYHKKYITIFTIIDIILYSIILLSRVEILAYTDNYTAGGLATLITEVTCGVFLLSTLIVVLLNRKRLDKRHIFVFIMLALLIFLLIIVSINPSLIFISIFVCFINYVMYFTIENPDVRMIEQLNIAKDQADRANKAKTDFLSSMSHEIRTPLNAIDGFSQLILEEDNIDTIKDEARDIMAASQNLLEIVNGILDISKIEADKLEIVNVSYEPAKIFDELVKLTHARIGEKPLELKVNIANDIPEYLNGDYVRVKQIILNLLTNAVKYTKEGFVEFNVKCVKKNNVCRLIISVKDTGIGIKKDNINKLFTKFERLDKEKNMTIEGTGLGLAITKKLVDLMHGTIVVDSIYGEGSTFTVSIDQKIENKTNVKVADVKVVDKINIKGKKILIVDDNLINLKVAARLLEGYKVETECVSSGFDCLKLYEEGASFDMILMDDMMPKMSGVETFKKLQEIEGFKTPVIALTANAIAGMKEKYLKDGFNDYISKPIDKKELERVLKAYLN